MLDLMCRWPSLHGIGLAVKLHLQGGQNARRNFKDVYVYIYIIFIYVYTYIYISFLFLYTSLYLTDLDRTTVESLCCRLARLLTDQENHRTQTEYEAAFLWKAQDSFVGTFFEKNVEKL